MDKYRSIKKKSLSNRQLRRICNVITTQEVEDISTSDLSSACSSTINYVPDLNVMDAFPDIKENFDGRIVDALSSLPHSSTADCNLLRNLALKREIADIISLSFSYESITPPKLSLSKAFLNKNSLRDDLESWTIEYNTNQNALSALLKILKPHVSENIPSDGRALLHTVRNVPSSIVLPGKYCHIGLDKAV